MGQLVRQHRAVVPAPVGEEHVVPQRNCPVPGGAQHDPAQQTAAVYPHPAAIQTRGQAAELGALLMRELFSRHYRASVL
ncbi:MAG TPA: hypothetical protein VF252_04230 [Gemmatimonadales bacterium]